MKIELVPMPQPVDGICVGTIDKKPLVYHARIPSAAGIELTHAQIADALKEAVDEACEALWGSEWSGPLSTATGLNRRSCSKDRVWKFGLPAWALRFIAEASSQRQPRAIGDFLTGIARVHDDDALKSGTVRPRSAPSREILIEQVQGRLIQAVDLLYTMRKARVQAQSRGGDLETNP